jgi:hypothetical protein
MRKTFVFLMILTLCAGLMITASEAKQTKSTKPEQKTKEIKVAFVYVGYR